MSVCMLSRRLGQMMIAKPVSSSSRPPTCTILPSMKMIMTRYQSKDSKAPQQQQQQGQRISKDSIAVNTQHEEWVKFQQSISVDGFETGQTTSVTTAALLGRKDRGGKSLRRRKQRELAARMADQEQMMANLGGGEFPVMRMGEEETERLLKEAYAAVPPRAGSRKVRQKKRNENRMEIKRQYAKLKKQERVQTHFRRMQKRSDTIKAVLQMKHDAIQIRQTEQEYQQRILQKYQQILQANNATTTTAAAAAAMTQPTETQQPQTSV